MIGVTINLDFIEAIDNPGVECSRQYNLVYAFDNDEADAYSRHTNYSLNEIISENIVLEIFSKSKFISPANAPEGVFYEFIKSEIYPSLRASNPVVVDFYKNKSERNDYLGVIRIGEKYLNLAMYVSNEKKIYTALKRSDYEGKSYFTFEDDMLKRISKVDLFSTAINKVTAFNLQLSPGHYIEDELPFTINLCEIAKLCRDGLLKPHNFPKILFTKALGLDVWQGLKNNAIEFRSREDIYSSTHHNSYWLIPPVSDKYLSIPAPVTLINMIRNYSNIRTPQRSSSAEILYCFGLRSKPRNGMTFGISAEDICQFNNKLQLSLSDMVGYKIILSPIVDSEIFDDSVTEISELELMLYESACRIFNKTLINTFGCDLERKLKILNLASFGVYPFGSGSDPFGRIINKPIFIHGPQIGKQTSSGAFYLRSRNLISSPMNGILLNDDSQYGNCIIKNGDSYTLNIEVAPKIIAEHLKNIFLNSCSQSVS